MKEAALGLLLGILLGAIACSLGLYSGGKTK